MPAKFTNNAFGTLASSINNTITTITLTAGNGARFPSLSAGEFFYATLIDSSNNLEIVQVTARSTDSLTVVRGQDGTTGRAYSAGDRIELRPVAAALTNMVQLDGAQTITGAKTFSGAITLSGGGTKTGTYAGNHTYSGTVTFSNTITGSVSGNAGTVTNGVYTTGDQSIAGIKTFTGTYATFNGVSGSYNGSIYIGPSRQIRSVTADNRWEMVNATNTSVIYTFANNGDFTAAGNVTAYSDERLKSDIKTIAGALDAVKALRGASFVKDGKSGIGVIAQEVQQVFPEVVQENADGYLSVAYGNLVGVLIEAVKELSEKVDALEMK